MNPTAIARPGTDEHSASYAGYIALVPEGDLITHLREQIVETVSMLQGLTPGRADYAYGPGKWTVKEVVGHLIDGERIFGYRALRIARDDQTELAGFDENAYVAHANFGRRTLPDLLEEFQVVRASTIHLASHLDGEALARRGSANKHGISVRALFYMIAGHERHHVRLLKERYLK